MRRTHRYITSLFLAAALATPLVTIASPRPQDDPEISRSSKDSKDTHRVYDAKHKAVPQLEDDNENQSLEPISIRKSQKGSHFFQSKQEGAAENTGTGVMIIRTNDRDNELARSLKLR